MTIKTSKIRLCAQLVQQSKTIIWLILTTVHVGHMYMYIVRVFATKVQLHKKGYYKTKQDTHAYKTQLFIIEYKAYILLISCIFISLFLLVTKSMERLNCCILPIWFHFHFLCISIVSRMSTCNIVQDNFWWRLTLKAITCIIFFLDGVIFEQTRA